MRNIIFILCAVISLLIAQQTTPSPGRVEHQIRLTDQMLEETSSAIGEGAPLEARQYFQQAQALNSQAWDAFEAGNMTLANQLTEQARTYIQRAKSALVKKPDEEQARIMRILEKNNELAQQLGAKLTANPNKDLQNMFDNALKLCRDAEKLLDNNDISSAGKLARQAQTMLKKIHTQLAGAYNDDKIAQSLDKTDEMIFIVEDKIGENAPAEAKSLIASARELQSSARQAFDKGDKKQAAQLTLDAKKKLQQAQNIGGTSVSKESISRQIERAREALQNTNLNENSTLALQVTKALELLDKASSAIEKNEFDSAEGFVNSARKIIAQIVSETETEPSVESVKKALEMTDKLINESNITSDAGKSLLEQANSLQQQAKSAFDKSSYSDALNKTRVAREMVEKAKEAK